MECWYFNSKAGCRNGDSCTFVHRKKDLSEIPKCRNYRGPGTCRYGDRCIFRHDDEITEHVVKSTGSFSLADGAEAAVVKPKVLSSSSLKTGTCSMISSEDDDKENKFVAEMKNRKKKRKGPKKSQKSHEKYLSVKIDNKVKDDSTPIKSAKLKVGQVSGAEGDSNNNEVALTNQSNDEDDEDTNQNADDKTYTCGECGVEIQDTQSDTEDLDELEKHYKEYLLKMDKNHLKFLQSDLRFKHPTACGVCGKHLVNSYSLLRHITDKIKSMKNDWKSHEDFLESIITGLWERDIGINSESESLDWLLLHLVDSYEGEDTDSDDSEQIDGMNALFGLMALKNHLSKLGGPHFSHDNEEDDSPDSDDYGNPWGMDDDDIYELACQGIKPWDPEAMDALAVLNGGDDYDFF